MRSGSHVKRGKLISIFKKHTHSQTKRKANLLKSARNQPTILIIECGGTIDSPSMNELVFLPIGVVGVELSGGEASKFKNTTGRRVFDLDGKTMKFDDRRNQSEPQPGAGDMPALVATIKTLKHIGSLCRREFPGRRRGPQQSVQAARLRE